LPRVGEDGQALEGAVVANAPRDPDGDLGPPRGIERDRPKRVAEDVTDTVQQFGRFDGDLARREERTPEPPAGHIDGKSSRLKRQVDSSRA